MTIVTKGMGAIIKLINKGKDIQKRNEASKKMYKDAIRKTPYKAKNDLRSILINEQKKSLLDITPRKIGKSVNKDIKDAAKDISKLGENFIKTTGKLVKNKTVGTGAVAAGTSAVVRKKND
jgi:Fe-S cluster biosynthesis and repair protein YggX